MLEGRVASICPWRRYGWLTSKWVGRRQRTIRDALSTVNGPQQVRFSTVISPSASPQRTWLAAVLLLLLPLVAYSSLWRAGFIWDDDAYVTNNKTLRSLDGLRRIWFEPRSIPQYYPLVHTTFWIEYHLWQLDPAGYHLVNVVLHATSAILLWRLLLKLKVPGAWLAAAIFAVHPVMVESVAWVTERKNVLSLVLALAALHCYLRYAPAEPLGRNAAAPSERRRYYFFSLAFFLSALFSKTVVFSLPAVILVIYWWKRGRINWADVKPLLPFFALGICLGATTAWLEKTHVGATGELFELTPIERLMLAGRVFWFYARKLFWPHPLIFFYHRWTVDQSVWWQYLYTLAFVALVALLFAWRNRIGRGPLAAVLIFAGVLTPALGFFDVFPFLFSYVADHFQYHASIALITLAAAGSTLLARRWHLADTKIGAVPVVAILLALGLLTYRQTLVYHNLETLYLDTLAKNPTSTIAYNNLADHYANTGRPEQALQLARQGYALAPNSPDLNNLIGGSLLRLGAQRGFQPGQLDEAMEHFRTAIRMRSNDPDPYFNLANALTLLGRYQEALANYQQALELAFNPDDVPAMSGIVKSLVQLGRASEAQPYIDRILRLDPQNTTARYGRAVTQAQQGRVAQALRELEAVLRDDPQQAEAHFELANILARQQNFAAAAEHYQQCVRLLPHHVRALNNLGIMHMQLGRTDEAIQHFSEAVRLAPEYAEARNNLERAKEFQRANPDPASPASS